MLDIIACLSEHKFCLTRKRENNMYFDSQTIALPRWHLFGDGWLSFCLIKRERVYYGADFKRCKVGTNVQHISTNI